MLKMNIKVKVVTPLEKYVKMLENGQVGLVDDTKDATIFENEQPAFVVRKNIIKQLGSKTRVTFEYE